MVTSLIRILGNSKILNPSNLVAPRPFFSLMFSKEIKNWIKQHIEKGITIKLETILLPKYFNSMNDGNKKQVIGLLNAPRHSKIV